MSENLTPPRFQELDALRGIAALMVVLFHYSMPYQDRVSYAVFKYGTTGVDLFFIISGFVIFQSISRVKSAGEFLINRFSRLYPTYWTAVTFTLLVYIFTENVVTHNHRAIHWDMYWYNLTMFQYYAGVDDFDGPYWTMIIEMVFYLLMCVLLMTRLIKFTVPILVLMVIMTTLLTEYYKGQEVVWDILIYFPLSQFLPLFLSGIIFYRIAVFKERRIRFFLLLIGCYLAQILLFNHGGRSRGFITHAEYKLMLTIYYTLFFLFVYGKLHWIVNPVTLFLGKISFPLYLIHQYVSLHCIIHNMSLAGFNFYFIQFAVALPICLVVATIIAFTVERRASAYIRKRLIAGYEWIGRQWETRIRTFTLSRAVSRLIHKF